MNLKRSITLLQVLTLLSAISLALVVIPSPAEANCYPWESQTRWVTYITGLCCSGAPKGRSFKQREEIRYRVPDCSWGPWQNTGTTRWVCVANTCPDLA